MISTFDLTVGTDGTATLNCWVGENGTGLGFDFEVVLEYEYEPPNPTPYNPEQVYVVDMKPNDKDPRMVGIVEKLWEQLEKDRKLLDELDEQILDQIRSAREAAHFDEGDYHYEQRRHA